MGLIYSFIEGFTGAWSAFLYLIDKVSLLVGFVSFWVLLFFLVFFVASAAKTAFVRRGSNV